VSCSPEEVLSQWFPEGIDDADEDEKGDGVGK
jgi:hypothetical protein